MLIREAKEQDLEGIVASHCSDVEKWHGFRDDKVVELSYEELSPYERCHLNCGQWLDRDVCKLHLQLLEEMSETAFVAELEGKVVGEAEVCLADEPLPYGRYAFMTTLMVHKDFRRSDFEVESVTFVTDKCFLGCGRPWEYDVALQGGGGPHLRLRGALQGARDGGSESTGLFALSRMKGPPEDIEADPSLPIQKNNVTFATHRAIDGLPKKAEFLSPIDELDFPCSQLARSWNYDARLMSRFEGPFQGTFCDFPQDFEQVRRRLIPACRILFQQPHDAVTNKTLLRNLFITFFQNILGTLLGRALDPF